MFGVIKINFGLKNDRIERTKEWLAKKGYVGSLLLGIIFALAFCPYSGVLFFWYFNTASFKFNRKPNTSPVICFGYRLTSYHIFIFDSF